MISTNFSGPFMDLEYVMPLPFELADRDEGFFYFKVKAEENSFGGPMMRKSLDQSIS